ncbi:acyl-CoA dehydrogenase family protein [Mycobacterium paraterrae]|uniref:Acyl-CoA dehydrogenase family protein n=1 Tax=Mycobacterium paraterrae TaxID=577492 RepID=A0ABY3VQB2_9MYCO|nr:acyl-CoA dehydrogenase family protein [Mycobacterium paraterrae]UMB71640.1 acyl-CoA dehydrogenase family protein [Mycobacterium paraterrae]
MTAAQVMEWLETGRLQLPPPGSGQTAQRWRRLSQLAEIDIAAARLAEAHTDAVAILIELGGPLPGRDELWGVWAAEAPNAIVTAHGKGDAVTLDGTKAWCSGAELCTDALVTARLADGRRGLFALDLRAPGVHPLEHTWRNAGMAECDTRSVRFDNAPAIPVGGPDDYLDRPGFWFGAIGVAACWLGGARAVAAPLYQRAARLSADDHALAHLGAIDAALNAADTALRAAAGQVDSDPDNRSGLAELTARRVRAVVEVAVEEALNRTDRALGPGPLCLDERHARAVADLRVYVRQSHAERDLAVLGSIAAKNYESF